MTVREALEAIGYDLSKTVGSVPILEIGLRLDCEIGQHALEVTEMFCRPECCLEAVCVEARIFRDWYGNRVALYLELNQAKTRAGVDRFYGNMTEYLPLFCPPEEEAEQKWIKKGAESL